MPPRVDFVRCVIKSFQHRQLIIHTRGTLWKLIELLCPSNVNLCEYERLRGFGIDVTSFHEHGLIATCELRNLPSIVAAQSYLACKGGRDTSCIFVIVGTSGDTVTGRIGTENATRLSMAAA